MVSMTFIWWIYHFWARFWPYFNFVDFRAYFGPFSLVNRVQFSNADAGAWNSFLRLGIIFYGKLMHKDTKFCYSSFDISTFGFKAPPYWSARYHLGFLSLTMCTSSQVNALREEIVRIIREKASGIGLSTLLQKSWHFVKSLDLSSNQFHVILMLILYIYPEASPS